ncbi:uncharacterized protein FA14DRAFT_173581 [Meira miltonrushii]|uniref:3'-5' exonuclease n=1 Tax=Meira miltonrushii TaxID=1280837 RepID=A0A316V9B1_9BASI|nr:uncharacterized protein FA14DRAFT_173581 [Meira miltonrushii]PWN33834.1 hypothetical protein FA14DRAFT_173581 [Meira miltonrushii]
MFARFVTSWFSYASSWRNSLQVLQTNSLGAHRGRKNPNLSYKMSSSSTHNATGLFGEQSHSPIDLTSSPPQPTPPARMFGKDVTNSNSSLLRQLDNAYTTTQVRTLTTASKPIPPAEPVRRVLPSMPSKKRNKILREWERTSLEKHLVAYSFKRPAGRVWAMRKKPEEVDAERAELHWAVFKGQSTNARIAVSPVRIPTLHFCKTIEESNACLPKIEAGEMLSFDMEWEVDPINHKSKKTSVVQLASATDIYVLHLAMMPSLPEGLLRILADFTILKCGVAIKQDAAKFRRDFDKEVNGCLELSAVAKHADPKRWKSHVGMIALRDLSRIYLNRKLDKSIEIRAGKWESANLDDRQCEYAANDVYVGVELIHTLAGMIGNLDPLKEGKDVFQTTEFGKFLVQVNRAPGQEKGSVSNKKGESSKDAGDAKPISSELDALWTDATSSKLPLPSGLEDAWDEDSKIDQIAEQAESSSEPSPETLHSSSRPKPSPAVKNGSAIANDPTTEQTLPVTKISTADERVHAKRKLPSEQSSPDNRATTTKPRSPKKDRESTSEAALRYWKKGSTFEEIAGLLRKPPYALSTVAGHVLKSLSAKNVSLKGSEKARLRIELKPDKMFYARKTYKMYLVRQDIIIHGTIQVTREPKPPKKKTKADRRPSASSSSSGRSSSLSL